MKNICTKYGGRVIRDRVQYWEIIADNLSKAGWSWDCVSAVDSEGRTIWIVDAHGRDGNRFVVQADEKLSASVELERARESDLTTAIVCSSPSRERMHLRAHYS